MSFRAEQVIGLFQNLWSRNLQRWEKWTTKTFIFCQRHVSGIAHQLMLVWVSASMCSTVLMTCLRTPQLPTHTPERLMELEKIKSGKWCWHSCPIQAIHTTCIHYVIENLIMINTLIPLRLWLSRLSFQNTQMYRQIHLCWHSVLEYLELSL